MQSQRNEASFSQQSFDMRPLAAAMPQPHASQNYQPLYQPVNGYSGPTTMFYPTHNNVQPNRTHTWRENVAGFNDKQALYGLGWNAPRSQPASLWAQNKPATVPLSLNPAQQPHPELPRTPALSNPRGPPRKPKRSEYALWVGNLPPTTRIEELKDHFSAGATQDIESVFLISKSNCAFVNYDTEGACISAMKRFHRSRFEGRTLACRLRKSQLSAAGSTSPESHDVKPDLSLSPQSSPTSTQSAVSGEPRSPVIVGGNEKSLHEVSSPSSPVEIGNKSIPARYFILKSLTLEDLEASVITCSWATQPHNEDNLNKAHAEAGEVFLIFSANRSREYFGYARMTSSISSTAPTKDVIAATTPAAEENATGSPRVIPTLPTATAPKGRIIDDLARGSIFWEADRSSSSADSQYSPGKGRATPGNGHFGLEWISTTRIPFVHTRGMRNPWNGNREIKIARDGQELDPRVGRRLLQLFRTLEQSGTTDVANPSFP